MGTSLASLIGTPILICDECSHHIGKVKDLVKGSSDTNDVRCPECGSSQFLCAYCFYPATRFTLESNDLTWCCYDGCNP